MDARNDNFCLLFSFSSVALGIVMAWNPALRTARQSVTPSVMNTGSEGWESRRLSRLNMVHFEPLGKRNLGLSSVPRYLDWTEMRVPGLGTMRFGLRSTSVADVNKVGAGLITSRRVIFTPSGDIKNELKATSISITCIDRYGNVVKRVTSTDDAEVEDPENESSNQAPSGNQTQGTGDNTQGGNQSQTPPANNQGGGSQTGDNNQSGGSDDGGDGGDVGNY